MGHPPPLKPKAGLNGPPSAYSVYRSQSSAVGMPENVAMKGRSRGKSVAGVHHRRLGQGGAQILGRVHRSVVDAHFIVQMRAGAAAGESYVADHVAAAHMLARRHRES